MESGTKPRGQKYGGRTVNGGCPKCGKPVLDFTDEPDFICEPCRVKHNLPAKVMPPYVPWYKLMSEEELAAILAKTSSAGRTRWLEDAAAAIPPSGLCVVLAEYQMVAGGTKPFMVGKVIPHAHYGRVFYHAFQAKQERLQEHHTSNCPVPVDTILVDWLTYQGIVWYYAFNRDARRLWKIKVEQLADAPAMEYTKETTRQRYFAERNYWESVGNLVEKPSAASKGAILVPDKGKAEAILRIPFVPERDTITLRHVPKY